jgi:predicted nucleic acid-binding Zn ribbon protein
VLYPVAVHFKGSGFYTTDYGRGSRKKEPPAKESSKDSSSSDGAGESKPKEKAAES